MRHIIVATHGKFAEGILDSVRLIMGEHKEVQPFCAFVEQGGEFKRPGRCAAFVHTGDG